MARRLSLVFAAGVFGAIVSTIVAWACGTYGLDAAAGVRNMTPGLGPANLYARLVWGGIWGLLFLLPLRTRSAAATGLIVSLVPTVADLLYFLPRAGGGWFGMNHGRLTPLLVFAFNAVWGISAGLWWRGSGGK